MNIKNIIMLSCITLQLSILLYADQAAWNLAFKTFSDKTNLKEAAEFIEANGNNFGTGNGNASKANSAPLNGSPEAKAVGFYLAAGNPNTFANKFSGAAPQSDLLTALATAKSMIEANEKIEKVEKEVKQLNNLTPPAAQPISDTIQANWNAAFTAFGGASVVRNRTNAASADTNFATIANSAAHYNDARVILQYLKNQVLHETDNTNLQNALNTADPITPIGDNIQANWDAAFTAFGGVVAVKNKTKTAQQAATILQTIANTNPQPTHYADARVVAQYLSNTIMNSTDNDNLEKALAASLNKLWMDAFNQFGGVQSVYNKTVNASTAAAILSGIHTTAPYYHLAEIIKKHLANETLTESEKTNLQDALIHALPAGTFQISDDNQTNWDVAFTRFGGASSVYKKEKTPDQAATILNNIAPTAVFFKDAKVVAQYLTDATKLNPIDLINLETALIAKLPAGTVQLSDNVQANWEEAFKLFGGAQNIKNKTNAASADTTFANIAKNAAHYRNARVIVQYLKAQTLNTQDSQNLQRALTQSLGATQVVNDARNTDNNWTPAFAQFGDALDIYNKNATLVANADLILTGIKTDETYYPNAQVIKQYLKNEAMNETDSQYLQKALNKVLPANLMQISDDIQAYWDVAFTRFGGASSVYAKEKTADQAATILNGISTAAIYYKDAQVIAQYLTDVTKINAIDLINLETALIAKLPAGTVQLSDNIQANWDAAFTVFGGAETVYKKTNAAAADTTFATIAKNAAHYRNARVIVQYLKGQTLNSVDTINFENALPAGMVQISDDIQANWQAAFNAFGGTRAVQNKEKAADAETILQTITDTNPQPAHYADARVVAKYIKNQTLNTTDNDRLQKYLVALMPAPATDEFTYTNSSTLPMIVTIAQGSKKYIQNIAPNSNYVQKLQDITTPVTVDAHANISAIYQKYNPNTSSEIKIENNQLRINQTAATGNKLKNNSDWQMVVRATLPNDAQGNQRLQHKILKSGEEYQPNTNTTNIMIVPLISNETSAAAAPKSCTIKSAKGDIRLQFAK